jgi:hypothetical protein
MDSHKSTSAALSSLPALFREVNFVELKYQQVSILTTLKEQSVHLGKISVGFEGFTTKHNELVDYYTTKITQLTDTQKYMSIELSSLKTETSELKGMVSEVLRLLQAAPTPNPTGPKSIDASTEAHASVEGEKLVTITPIRKLFQQLDPHRKTKNDAQTTPTTEVITEAVPLRSFMPGSTTSTPIITPVISEATTTTTRRPNKGKEIKVTDDSPPKLVPASKEVRRDPDALELVEVTLHNGKIFRGTNEEVAAALEEDDKLKAELLSKPVITEVAKEVIKESNQDLEGEEFVRLQANMIKEANLKAKQVAKRKHMKGMSGP